MNTAFGHVQTELDPQDAALMKLYDLLSARNAPKPGSFTSLSDDGKREYFRVSRRRSRAQVKSAQDSGATPATTANIRDALADAALMILATGAPGADQVRTVLGSVFAQRPGVPMSVENKAKQGKLRPKLIARSEG